MKIAVIVGNKTNTLSTLTKIFTKCPAYHVAFVDELTNVCYDMYWIRRRRSWPRYEEQQVHLFDIDCVTAEYLEGKLTNDESEYGFLDYLLFGIRPVMHVFGKSTRNAKGVICSEMMNDDIWACGGTTPFPLGSVPSPCDFFNWLKDRG